VATRASSRRASCCTRRHQPRAIAPEVPRTGSCTGSSNAAARAAPHHVPKVSSLTRCLTKVSALGIGVLDGRPPVVLAGGVPASQAVRHRHAAAGWCRAMTRPRAHCRRRAGQLSRNSRRRPRRRPVDGAHCRVARAARELFTGALRGDNRDHGHGWLRFTWGPGRGPARPLRRGRPRQCVPVGRERMGVAHVVFGRGPLAIRELTPVTLRSSRCPSTRRRPYHLAVRDAGPGRGMSDLTHCAASAAARPPYWRSCAARS